MSDLQITGTAVQLEALIFIVRGQRVMLSPQLADLYGVETRVLVQAVQRNVKRFPVDFMFQLTDEEFANLKSQIVISSWGGSRRANPYAFTEQGVAMLSGVLRSDRAVAVNIEIMRTFVRLRRMVEGNAEMVQKLEELERKTNANFKIVFDAIRQIMTPPVPRQRRIGIRREEDEENKV